MPDKPEGDKSKTPEISRRKKLEQDGIEDPEMPPVEAAYLIGYLFEIGPTLPAGMGDAPVTQGEIESWQHNTGIELQPWETRFVRRLSIEYLNESHLARKPDAQAPWAAAPYLKPAPDRVAASLKASIRELAKL